jgi:hypothetical protein
VGIYKPWEHRYKQNCSPKNVFLIIRTNRKQERMTEKKNNGAGLGIGIGAALGVAFGAAYGITSDNGPLILAKGLAIGVAVGAIFDFVRNKK